VKDIRDFYITWAGHPRYKEGEIIVEDAVRLVINKIEMVLFTNKGEFIGDVNFGCDLPLYLWQTNVSVEFIKNVIQEQYDIYIPELRDFNTILDVQLVEGQLQDILVVNTVINEFRVNAIFS
jgi:hypothetical protein